MLVCGDSGIVYADGTPVGMRDSCSKAFNAGKDKTYKNN